VLLGRRPSSLADLAPENAVQEGTLLPPLFFLPISVVRRPARYFLFRYDSATPPVTLTSFFPSNLAIAFELERAPTFFPLCEFLDLARGCFSFFNLTAFGILRLAYLCSQIAPARIQCVEFLFPGSGKQIFLPWRPGDPWGLMPLDEIRLETDGS